MFDLILEAMLKQYCEQTGIEFDDSMVNWSELSEHEIKVNFQFQRLHTLSVTILEHTWFN